MTIHFERIHRIDWAGYLESTGCEADNSGFFIAAIERQPILKLRWKTKTPVWVDQWPLNAEKLSNIQELVQEQLEAGHIVPSTSPWNTPIFTIPKKNGKWHLLHDLHVIHAVMHDMGALQPGLPSPVMIPGDWNTLIIDLKEFFFYYTVTS